MIKKVKRKGRAFFYTKHFYNKGVSVHQSLITETTDSYTCKVRQGTLVDSLKRRNSDNQKLFKKSDLLKQSFAT